MLDGHHDPSNYYTSVIVENFTKNFASNRPTL